MLYAQMVREMEHHMSEIVDLQRIKDTSDGDFEFENTLIQEFLSDGRVHLAEIEEAMKKNQIAEARTLSHTLKGMSGNVGAVGIQAASLAIQEAADAGRLTSDKLASLKDVFGKTETFFQEYLAQYTD